MGGDAGSGGEGGGRSYHLVSAASAFQAISVFLLSTSLFKPVSCFTVSAFQCFHHLSFLVDRLSVSASFLFRLFLRRSGFMIAAVLLSTSLFELVSGSRVLCASTVSLFLGFVFSTSPIQSVSCFSGFCVSPVSSFLFACWPQLCFDQFLVSVASASQRFHQFCFFVFHCSVTTSFLFQLFLVFTGFVIPVFLLSTSPFQPVSCFSVFCVPAVSS